MKKIFFEIIFEKGKKLCFSSEIPGLVIDGKEYLAGADGILVYDKVKGVKADSVTCQLSTNTSTLIPALRVLGMPYNPYFDKREVLNSQNDITFYWKPSQLAAFYNRFSTDDIKYGEREPVIKKAIVSLTKTAKSSDDFLPIELLSKMKEPCKLLGFYQGFPVFDGTKGIPKLLSRIGIHIDPSNIMVSTPIDKYANDVEEIASILEKRTGTQGTRKKNRVRFEKTKELLRELKV
jgi:hypothetical protein